MPRTWLSVPIARTGIRIGRSIADAELRPRLPGWRRFELRKALQAAAEARGEPMSREDCDYVIDRTLEIATVDSSGLVLHLRGNRDKLINELSEILGFCDYLTTPEEAARLVDKAIARRSRPWFWLGAAIGVAIFLLAVFAAK